MRGDQQGGTAAAESTHLRGRHSGGRVGGPGAAPRKPGAPSPQTTGSAPKPPATPPRRRRCLRSSGWHRGPWGRPRPAGWGRGGPPALGPNAVSRLSPKLHVLQPRRGRRVRGEAPAPAPPPPETSPSGQGGAEPAAGLAGALTSEPHWPGCRSLAYFVSPRLRVLCPLLFGGGGGGRGRNGDVREARAPAEAGSEPATEARALDRDASLRLSVPAL